MKKILATTLAILIVGLGGANAARAQAALDPQAEKIKTKVNKIGVGRDVTVRLKTDDEYHGSVRTVTADGFTVYEVDLKQSLDLKFTDVKKVQEGYGHSRDRHGRRIPPSKLLIGLLIGAAAIIVPIVIMVGAKD